MKHQDANADMSSHLRSGVRRAGFTMKQFHIQQDRCGMKVSSDACLFGALIEAEGSRRALDIGTGTGLLALMVAQKSLGTIDAIDCDAAAVAQTQENVAASPFFDRVNVIQASLEDHIPKAPYDLIFCNPPFFDGPLPSRGGLERVRARHDTAMPMDGLFHSVARHLCGGGSFWILLPAFKQEGAKSLATQMELDHEATWEVADHPAAPPHRVVMFFHKPLQLCNKSESTVALNRRIDLFVNLKDRHLSPGSRALLRDYYLRC